MGLVDKPKVGAAIKVKAYLTRAEAREGRPEGENRPAGKHYLALTFKEFGGCGREWIGYIPSTSVIGLERLAALGVHLEDRTYEMEEVVTMISKQYGRLLDISVSPHDFVGTVYAVVDSWHLCVNKLTWNQREQMLVGGNCTVEQSK